MNKLVAVMLLLLFCSTFSVAKLHAQASEVLQAQFDELEAEFEEQSLRLGNKNPRKANRKIRAETSRRALGILEECEDAELAIEILNWIVKQNRGNRYYRKAHEVMVENYLDQPGIGDIFSQTTPTDVLESTLEKNNDEEVRAVANYLLGLRENNLEKAILVLTDLYNENGHVRYRGTMLSALVRVRLTSLQARKQSIESAARMGGKGGDK